MSKEKLFGRHAESVLVITLYLTCILYWHSAQANPTISGLSGNSKAEKYVIDQVVEGKPANLKKFDNEADRILTAEFLEGLLQHSLAELPENRRRIHIKYAVLTKPVNLEGKELPNEVMLKDCRFEDDVNLSEVRFKKPLSFHGSSFRTVGFSKTVFEGVVNFDTMKVGDTAHFDEATFAGLVTFNGTEIGRNFEAKEAKFVDVERGAFFGLKVGDDARFDEATFAGPVIFKGTQIGRNFVASGAKFTEAQASVNFDTMKVGETAHFNEATFAGPVTFKGADIGRDFTAEETQFSSADFDGLKVGGRVSFKTVFEGDAVITRATFHDILIVGNRTEKDRSLVPLLNLSGTMIKRGLHVENIDLREVNASFLRVEGRVELHRLTITEKANLEYSNLPIIKMDNVTWPSDPKFVELRGMSYYDVIFDHNPHSWNSLLEWVNRSAYSPSAYVTLEGFFRNQGEPELANETFLAWKRRERREVLKGTAWLWSLSLDALVSYGRKPAKAFLISIPILFLGWVVFRSRNGMVSRQPEDDSRSYSPFWYSLDLFAPVLNLGHANAWIPKENRHWLARHYMYVHRILGWILIPIGLAALTGLVK
jgi:uncharacterized protein YjbI with pentapeptide repeats